MEQYNTKQAIEKRIGEIVEEIDWLIANTRDREISLKARDRIRAHTDKLIVERVRLMEKLKKL